MSKLLSSDTSYRDWIQEVSKRFRQSQIRAAVKVNDEMLRFYWSLGKDISRMSENAAYGTGFYKAISADLQDIFPNVHSFSVTNLKYMRYFISTRCILSQKIVNKLLTNCQKILSFVYIRGIMQPILIHAATIRIKLYFMCGRFRIRIDQVLYY